MFTAHCSAGLSKKGAWSLPTPLVLESAHPYEHNADRRETVRVKGARKLLINFDERTRCGTVHGRADQFSQEETALVDTTLRIDSMAAKSCARLHP